MAVMFVGAAFFFNLILEIVNVEKSAKPKKGGRTMKGRFMHGLILATIVTCSYVASSMAASSMLA